MDYDKIAQTVSMLVIRDTQIEILSAQMAAQFEQSAVEHILACFLNAAEDMGTENLTENVRWGISRARAYGFSDEFDVLRYLNLMFSLGLEFDSDPQYPWAAAILGEENTHPAMRMDALTIKALEVTENTEEYA